MSTPGHGSDRARRPRTRHTGRLAGAGRDEALTVGLRDDASLRRELAHNRSLFAAAVDAARERAEAGRHRSAVEWCRVASSYAMTNATGQLRSTELEEVVDEVAARVLRPGPGRGGAGASSGGRRVLHVLTEAHAVGGLTRLVARWIARDRRSASSVAVTRQGQVAEVLARAACESGGTAVALGAPTADPLERAQRLRDLASGADVVVCHLHSDDVVTAAAFGAGYDGPPVALYNHADHLFWLAPSGTRVVVDARDAGLAVSRRARGVPAELSFLLPLPIPRVDPPDPPRAASLRVDDDQVVGITVARQIKFQDTRFGPTFGQLIAAALAENPQLVFCAVGPAADAHPWPALRRSFGDRVVLPGPVADPLPYLGAADIYLDTFPFSSTTSLLEATAAALPAVSLDAHRGLTAVLGLADLLPEGADRPRDVEGFLDRISELVGSAELRSSRGAAARRGYLGLTEEGPWLDSLERLYERLGSAPHGVLGGRPTPPTTEAVVDLGLALVGVEQNVPLLWSVAGAVHQFDAEDADALRRRVLLSRVERKLRTLVRRAPWRADTVLIRGPRRPVGRSLP